MVLDKYQVFVKVAETRNLSKAAEELNYTHAAISYIIKNLEEEVGMKLLIRSKAGIHLTKEGAALLEEAQKVVKYENSFLQKASMLRGLEEGVLDIGAFTSVSMKWMPHILREMKDKYPGVKVRQHHGNYKEIEYWLEKEKVDVAFLTEYHKGDFDFIPLMQDEYYVILPPGHPLCAYERIPKEALNGETLILMNEGSEDYDAGHILEGLHYTVAHWVNEDVVLIPLVECGLGISVLPKLIMDFVHSNVVVKRFACPRYRTIGLAVKNPDEMSGLTKLFISLMKEYIASIQNLDENADDSKFMIDCRNNVKKTDENQPGV